MVESTKAMSTEPNTQRAIVLAIDECAKQIELYAQSNDGRNIERAHAYRHCSEFLTEFCKQPPPETGAVDVEKKARECSARLAHDVWLSSFKSPVIVAEQVIFPELHEAFKLLVTPLTARIAGLEKQLETVTKGSFEASQAMAAVNAELRARVKEMEEKLEGALKLTTANSIEHVSKLER